jgi:hypothetical protein
MCIGFAFIQTIDEHFDRAAVVLAVLVCFLSDSKHQHPQLLMFYSLLLFISLLVYQPAIANSSCSLLPKNPNPELQALISCLLSQNILLLLSLTVTTRLYYPMRVRLLTILPVVTMK